MTKIDFILPWVDSSDIKWEKEKEKFALKYNHDDYSSTRFRDLNTLKYVLRSIEKYCPWYNKIYLITEGHIPIWLDTSYSKIKIITHKELYFNSSHLPTFSSRSIEMNLANLKNVSEYIVYLNDDMIMMNPIKIERFFKEGKPVDFLSHGWIPRNNLFERIKTRDVWIHSLNNNLSLINKKYSVKFSKKYLYSKNYTWKTKISNLLLAIFYKKLFWLQHWHHPQPYLMSNIKGVYSQYKNEMLACSSNRFRKNNDLTQYIYRYWHLIKYNFIPYQYDDGVVAKIESYNYLNNFLPKLKDDKKIKFLCLNDQMEYISDDEFEKTKTLLTNYLEKYFPEKSKFEK